MHMKADDRVLLAIIAGAALLELAARYRRRKQQPQVLGGHAARTPPDTQQPQETQEAARLLSGERSQPPSPPPVSFAVDALAGFALSDASAIAEVEAKAGGAKALGKQLIQALHEKGHATILPLITPAAARVKNKVRGHGRALCSRAPRLARLRRAPLPLTRRACVCFGVWLRRVAVLAKRGGLAAIALCGWAQRLADRHSAPARGLPGRREDENLGGPRACPLALCPRALPPGTPRAPPPLASRAPLRRSRAARASVRVPPWARVARCRYTLPQGTTRTWRW